jgi:hypothetical protein
MALNAGVLRTLQEGVMSALQAYPPSQWLYSSFIVMRAYRPMELRIQAIWIMVLLIEMAGSYWQAASATTDRSSPGAPLTEWCLYCGDPEHTRSVNRIMDASMHCNAGIYNKKMSVMPIQHNHIGFTLTVSHQLDVLKY